jgi:tetratricopeptide (TPR) repeat protein
MLSLVVGLQPGPAEDKWQWHMGAGNAAFAKADYAKAEQAFAAAVEVVGRWHRDDEHYPAALLKCAEAQLAQGKYVQVEHSCAQAWPLFALLDGADRPKVARCLNVQAQATWALGRTEQAENLARLALAMRQKHLPKYHFAIAESIHTLAAMGRGYQRITTKDLWSPIAYDDSLVGKSLERQTKALGNDHPKLAYCLLAAVRARADESEKLLLRAIELVTRERGKEHPDVAEYWTELAHVYCRGEQYALAVKAQEHALNLLRMHFGPEHPRLNVALLNLSLIQERLGLLSEADATRHAALRCHFAGLTDDELCWAFDQLNADENYESLYALSLSELSHDEAYLTEMVRRKGNTIAAYLERQHTAVLKRPPSRDLSSRSRCNLHLLTGLRRVQGAADPLDIAVWGPKQQWESIFPNLPTIELGPTNVDKVAIWMYDGEIGFYGRERHWHVEVRDSQGKLLPSTAPPSRFGSGDYWSASLNADKSWQAKLDLRSFMELVPGDYTVRIQYHDRWPIASSNCLAGLIVSQSKTFPLHVQPRVIGFTQQERQLIKEQIDQLNDAAAALVLDGREYPWREAKDFLTPGSPPSKILTFGWKAVPALLDQLDAAKLTPQRRAWLLGLLFSITTWHDPRAQEGILDAYEQWGPEGLEATGGILDETKQRLFAQRWREFRNYIVVQEK